MQTCDRCAHPVAFHGSPAGCRAQYLASDPICGCNLHPDAYPPAPIDQLGRCKAEYHGPAGDFRCEIMVTEASTHVGMTEHRNGVLNWTEEVATYPLMREAYESPVPVPVSERQVGGDHYRRFKIQPWDIIDEYDLSFYEGSALKYLLRSKGDRLEDLKKARHYLDKLIEIEEEKGAEA